MTNLHPEIVKIIEKARFDGWVLEPDAKQILSLAGLSVPRFTVAKTLEEGFEFAHDIGYPVVAKIVSARVVHKSDVHGVVAGIADDKMLSEVFHKFKIMDGFSGMLVEEMIRGIELIMGAKNDFQFGPLILLGMGGTTTEIYRDVVLRMAPLSENDAIAMIKGLKAYNLLEGYRGTEPVDIEKLKASLILFSRLVLELNDSVESMDINPLFCSAKQCVVADARIILQTRGS